MINITSLINTKSLLLGVSLAFSVGNELFAQEKPDHPNGNLVVPSQPIPLKLNWVKTPADRTTIQAIEPGLIEALTVLGCRDSVSIELADLDFRRGAVSANNSIRINRSFFNRYLKSCRAAGLDEEQAGRVVAILIAPTIMHELKHVEDLASMREAVKEPLFYVGGKEIEALAHRQQGLAVAKLIESGLWSEVESVAKKASLPVVGEISWYHRRNDPLPSLIDALPTSYEDYPSLFDRGALIGANRRHQTNDDPLGANEATNYVLTDPGRYQRLEEIILRLIDIDQQYSKDAQESTGIEIREVEKTAKDAAYARRFGEPFTPEMGLQKSTRIFLAAVQEDPRLLENSEEIRLLGKDLMKAVIQQMSKKSDIQKLSTVYRPLADAIGLTVVEQREILEGILASQEESHAKMKRNSLEAEGTIPNLYREALGAKAAALEEIRGLIESIGH